MPTAFFGVWGCSGILSELSSLQQSFGKVAGVIFLRAINIPVISSLPSRDFTMSNSSVESGKQDELFSGRCISERAEGVSCSFVHQLSCLQASSPRLRYRFYLVMWILPDKGFCLLKWRPSALKLLCSCRLLSEIPCLRHSLGLI